MSNLSQEEEKDRQDREIARRTVDLAVEPEMLLALVKDWRERAGAKSYKLGLELTKGENESPNWTKIHRLMMDVWLLDPPSAVRHATETLRDEAVMNARDNIDPDGE